MKKITQIQKRLMCHHYRHYNPAFPLLAQPKLPYTEVNFRWIEERRDREKEEREREKKTQEFKWPCNPIGSLCRSSNKALDDKDVFQCGRC